MASTAAITRALLDLQDFLEDWDLVENRARQEGMVFLEALVYQASREREVLNSGLRLVKEFVSLC